MEDPYYRHRTPLLELNALWRREEEWAAEVLRQDKALAKVVLVADKLHQWAHSGDGDKISQLADELLEACKL